MATYLRDRFDDLPRDLQRRGAHRAPPKRGRGWIGLVWALVATVALIAIGLTALSLIGNTRATPDSPAAVTTAAPSPSSAATAAPKIDPELPLTILNGTTTPQLANKAGDLLVEQGWKGAAEGVGSRLNAAKHDIAQTVVVYSDPAHESAARALVLALGVGVVRQGNEYPDSPVTIVLGSDYHPAS
jgi:hypothetical protein